MKYEQFINEACKKDLANNGYINKNRVLRAAKAHFPHIRRKDLENDIWKAQRVVRRGEVWVDRKGRSDGIHADDFDVSDVLLAIRNK